VSVKDNLVSGTVVAELPLATAGVLPNGGWLAAALGLCLSALFDQRQLPTKAERLTRTIEVATARPVRYPRPALVGGLSSADWYQ
jgi:hypothetical protein